MSKDLHVNGRRHTVTDNMYAAALATRQRGGRVYFCLPEQDELNADDDRPVKCTNCDDNHNLLLQIVVGGPYEGPPAGVPSFWENDQWYAVKTQSYRCPVCTVDAPEPDRFPDVIAI